MSCLASNAKLISGITVSSKPTMPGNNSSRAASLTKKLSWISCLTVFEIQPLSRSFRSVVGLAVVVLVDMKTFVTKNK